MTGNDDSILEYLHEHDVVLPPTGLEINLDREGVGISYSTISRRLKKLQEHGLVKKVREKEGYYAITEKGRQYLAGDLDADELEE
ncbi:winged helix-turn-helix domain-containing protein [Haladaptatus sp. DYF46]|uniref:winged helix-turn-helix domain-containing protein n=1 Tax=Haladaptatus sp. DYF46 TaxID=2886041 RepID=UPI001E3EDA3C|nr:winged helix-turn-helix domain-containing protein [Haladaptatus sp. DYF46]